MSLAKEADWRFLARDEEIYDMNPFDDLPRQDRNHVVEDAALAAFESRVLESGVFTVQGPDRKDYGTDCQLEVAIEGSMTNVRLHVQVKGTERPLRDDGSIGVEVTRANLNYLLMNPYSFYVCHHLPTDTLFFCSADAVIRRYEQEKDGWTRQNTITILFTECLTIERLMGLAALARSSARVERDRRTSHAMADPAELSALLRNPAPALHVPDDSEAAFSLLERLYADGADEVISGAFDRFAALFGAGDDRMGPCYMAEINRGLDGDGFVSPRTGDAIAFFRDRLNDGRHASSVMHYTIGNGFAALGDDEAAKREYEAAMADPRFMAAPDLSASLYKNLGTSLSRLGNVDAAFGCYEEALRRKAGLPEAHVALGHHHLRLGQFEVALEHFDKVMVDEGARRRMLDVAGWRINVLFNLEDGRSAFREINTLLADAASRPWIWSWCARQVASFGRATPSNAQAALAFWQRYLRTHPDQIPARAELLSARLCLSVTGMGVDCTYEECRTELQALAEHCAIDGVAYLWDRLGHWAERERGWGEAERCYRVAFDLAGGKYGYCLGAALNALERFEESLPLLLEQAHEIQPDAYSWNQLAIAHEHLGMPLEAIIAYQRALEIDACHAGANFNLGGFLWNIGEHEKAAEVWTAAILRFPDDPRVAQVSALISNMLVGSP